MNDEINTITILFAGLIVLKYVQLAIKSKKKCNI